MLLLILHNDLLEENRYFWAGRLLAWIILHSELSDDEEYTEMQWFHEGFYHALAYGSFPDEYCLIDDIYDGTDQEYIHQVKSLNISIDPWLVIFINAMYSNAMHIMQCFVALIEILLILG